MAKQKNLFGDIDDLQSTIHSESQNLEEELKACRKRALNLKIKIADLEERVENMKDAGKKIAKIRADVEKEGDKKKKPSPQKKASKKT